MEQEKITQQVQDMLRTLDGPVTVDRLGTDPGSVGLYPLGQEEKLLRRDILGNEEKRVTCHYLLRYRAVPGQAAAERLEQFARRLRLWGVSAGSGRLTDPGNGGCGIYEMALTAET